MTFNDDTKCDFFAQVDGPVVARIASYLDGKSQSILALAAMGYDIVWETLLTKTGQELSHWRVNQAWIHSLCQRLLIDDDDDNQRNNRREHDNSSTKIARTCSQMNLLSKKLLILEYIHLTPHPQWPVWVGKIAVKLPHNRRISASIVLQGDRFSVPGSSLLHRHRIPTAMFRAEPMNVIPLPPFGSVHGLSKVDKEHLQTIASSLEGQVVVPHYFQQDDPLNIRILTRQEALVRLNRVPLTRYRDQIPNSPLVCFWHEHEGDMLQPISYIKAMLKVTERLRS